MADEAPIKLIQIGPKGGEKKDGFNLVTEKVVSGQSRCQAIGGGIAGVRRQNGGARRRRRSADRSSEAEARRWRDDSRSGRKRKRIAKSFRIRSKDPNAAKADAMLLDLKDTHWLNRKYAAESLGELKDLRAVGPLVEALSDEVGDIRQRAYDSLIKLGDPPCPRSFHCSYPMRTSYGYQPQRLFERSASPQWNPWRPPWGRPTID